LIPDISVLWIIVIVMLLAISLDRFLLKPILRVMDAREEAIRSARELAERSASEARAASAEFEQKTTAARAEIYRQMDEMRRTALGERAEIMAATRAEAEAQVVAATASIQAETEEAKRRLDAEAEQLGAAVAERLLGRRAS
jgi:F-type H+-transporting ATPase subunit b